MAAGNTSYTWSVYDYLYCDRVLSQNISITVPGSGRVVNQNMATITIMHFNTRTDGAWLYIEEPSSYCAQSPWQTYLTLNSALDSGNIQTILPIQAEFSVPSAGTYQYYLDVYVNYITVFGFGGSTIDYSNWVAVYHPS